MSMLSSDLNCLAVVGVEDYYRMLKPDSSDRQRLRVGKLIVAFCGALAVLIAIILAKNAGAALGLYFIVSSIVAGGLFGLFGLAFLSTRVNRKSAWVGIVASLLFTTYGVVTKEQKALNLGPFNFPWHPIMIGVLAHVVLAAVGYAASFFFSEPALAPDLTIWGWLRKRRATSEHLIAETKPEVPPASSKVSSS